MTTIRPAPAFQIESFQLMNMGKYPLPFLLCCGWACYIIDVSPVADNQPRCEHVAALSSGSMLANFERIAEACWTPAVFSMGRRGFVPFVPDLDPFERLDSLG